MNEKLTFASIAREFGVTRQCIHDFSKRIGIKDLTILREEIIKKRNKKKESLSEPKRSRCAKYGFVYIGKMIYQNDCYYKIGRTTHPAKREGGLKNCNPFLSITAIKYTKNYTTLETEIKNHLFKHRFFGEWYKLTEDQYKTLYEEYGFFEFNDYDRSQKNYAYLNDLYLGRFAEKGEEKGA